MVCWNALREPSEKSEEDKRNAIISSVSTRRLNRPQCVGYEILNWGQVLVVINQCNPLCAKLASMTWAVLAYIELNPK